MEVNQREAPRGDVLFLSDHILVCQTESKVPNNMGLGVGGDCLFVDIE